MMRNKFVLFSFIICTCIFSVSCGINKVNQNYMEMTTFAMDTIMSFTIDPENSEGDYIDVDKVFIEVEQLIREYENIFSVTKKDSDVSHLNNGGFLEEIEVSGEVLEILKIASEISLDTDGTFSVAINPLVSLWGFTTGDEQSVPSEEKIQQILNLINWEDIYINEETKTVQFLKEGMSIDLGGIAKGYVAEKVTHYLYEQGIVNGHFSLGGNISTIGLKSDNSKWKIAVQNPLDNSNHIGVLDVTDTFVVTSGGYQRYFVEDDIAYHHILDSSTGYPVNNELLSVTIICDDGTKADALSTALFVMGLDKSLEYWKDNKDFEVIFVTDDEVIATLGANEYFTFEGRDNDFYYRFID